MSDLRPYQKEAVYKLHGAVNSGRHPLYCAPCRTGKTKTAVKFSYDRTNLKEIVFILTPQEEIFNQWMIEFVESGMSEMVGYINDKGVTGRNKKIYVCMPMSLVNILSVLPEKFKPDIIITDEAHRSEAATWQSIYNFYPDAKRVALTATPQRTDGQGLDNTYDMIIQTINMQAAIDQGYIVKPLLIVPEQYKIDVPIQNGDYDVRKQAELLGKTEIIGDIILQYKKIFNGLPIIIACSTYEHAELTTKAFCNAGWKFEHIHSKLATVDRKGILRRVKTQKINGICTVGIGVEGLDIPGLFGMIWLRRTLSLTVYIQFSSRPLTPMDGKKYGIIIDPVGNAFIHGPPEMHREWSLKGRDDLQNDPEIMAPKMKVCPICSVMNAIDNNHCHICGHDFSTEAPNVKGRKLPRMVDGELVLLDDSEFEGMDGRNDFFEEFNEQGKDNALGSKAEKPEAIELSRSDKMDILKNGLKSKNNLFSKTLEDFL